MSPNEQLITFLLARLGTIRGIAESSCEPSHKVYPEIARLAREADEQATQVLSAHETPAVQVAGDVLPTTLAQYELRASRLLEDEQAKPNPNNALVAFLCDTVRLARENERLGKAGIAVETNGDLALARNTLGNLYVAVERLGRRPEIPLDADVQFAMREAAKLLGPPHLSEKTVAPQQEYP